MLFQSILTFLLLLSGVSAPLASAKSVAVGIPQHACVQSCWNMVDITENNDGTKTCQSYTMCDELVWDKDAEFCEVINPGLKKDFSHKYVCKEGRP